MTTAILLVGGLLAFAFLVIAVTNWAQGIDDRIEAMVAAALDIEADDWDEPTRAQIEWTQQQPAATLRGELMSEQSPENDVARIVGRDLSEAARTLANSEGWADHARMHPALARKYEARVPACECPTDDYCPRCHPRWYAKWRAEQDGGVA